MGICVKIYQCMVVGCCRADAEKKVEGTQTIAHTIWIMLTNLEIFVTIGMLVADIVASFHIWGTNPTDEGKVYEHGDLFNERMLTQFLPIVLIYTIGLDLILNIAIFIIGKI